MKYLILALISFSSLVFAQNPAPPFQTVGQAELCAMAAQTTTAPRVAAGVTLPYISRIPSRRGLNIADGSVKDYMESDIYTYDGGNAVTATPKFYARYREPLKNLDNEDNAPRVGMMEIDPKRPDLFGDVFKDGNITCPVDAIYQNHWFQQSQDMKPGELICVKRDMAGVVTYAVLQVDAVCASPNWGIVFNWVAKKPLDSSQPNVFKADPVKLQTP